MNKIALLWIMASAIMLTWCGGGGTKNWTSAQVCNSTACFDVQIADTPQKHQEWLMWVSEMAENEGMLFVFEKPGFHKFWMKNTLIPLDMIWLDESGTVQYVKEYAPPCSEEDSAEGSCQLFGPEEGVNSKYVLELNANQARVSGIYEWAKLDVLNVK